MSASSSSTSSSSSSASPASSTPDQSKKTAFKVRTPPNVHDSMSRHHRRCMTTDNRALVFRLPVGDKVKVLVDSHATTPGVLRRIRNYLEELSTAEKNAPANGGDVARCFEFLGYELKNYLRHLADPLEEPGTLTIPIGLAGVFQGAYIDIAMWSMRNRPGLMNPRWHGEVHRTAISAENCIATSSSYYMRSLQCTSSCVHAFIRDKRQSSVTISYDEKDYIDLSEIDILAAINPKRAFALMNALFEVMSYTCFDETQTPGFSSRMIPAGETFNTPRGIYGRGIHALALQAVAGVSNTLVGHACFLFVVLTQLDEIEYAQYCRRMGLPDDLVVPGRRYSFIVTDPQLIGGTIMVPAGAAGSPGSLTQYLMAPMTPEKLGERKRSFDDSHPAPSPPLAPRTSRYGAPKPKKDSAHWDSVARAKHAELMSVVEKAEAGLVSAKHAVSTSGAKRPRTSVLPTGNGFRVVEERLPHVVFADRTTAYDVPPVKRHCPAVSIPSTPADRGDRPDLKCHESIDEIVIDDDNTPIDPNAGHASDYSDASVTSDTSDDDEPCYSLATDYDSL